jgi:uroporphyrinogen decarboxylase
MYRDNASTDVKKRAVYVNGCVAIAAQSSDNGAMVPHRTDPDAKNLFAVLRRERPARPTLFEFFLNPALERMLAGDLPERARTVKAFCAAGYDHVTVRGSDFGFPRREHATGRSISQNAMSMIHTRADLEAYPWPDPDASDDAVLCETAANLPDGMTIAVFAPDGVLENVTELVGFDNLCEMLYEDPELAGDVFDAVGSRLVRYYQRALAEPKVGIVIGNDDWGHKTGAVLSPVHMRRFVYPWHERIVALAHENGRPAILHSCGKLDLLMDDVIDGIGYDAKHSYEDGILPVEQAYERWGSRIAILGGIDLDFVCRAGAAAVRQRSQAMLDRSRERGGYALGTGNSVPDYVPVESYFAMIEPVLETRA